MGSLDIETLNQDGESLFRSQRIRFGGKELVTPVKALNPSKFRAEARFDGSVVDFNEIYKQITSDKIEALHKDPREHDRFCRTMENLRKRHHTDGGLDVCMVRFSSKGPGPFPRKNEIGFLTDVSHSFSDIVPMPMIECRIDGSNFGKYLECMQACYDTIEELNGKPIMGVLPTVPREMYPKLLEFYLERQVSAFCFDFEGSTPSILKLRPILRHLNSKKILDSVLVYGINAKPGHALKNSSVIPAKDFISYGFGLDILGENHVPPRIPRVLGEKLRRAADRQKRNKKRLFIKSDYGYYKTDTRDGISPLYPKQTKIRLDDIFDGPAEWQSLFNMEQQSLEAGALRNRLNSPDGGETVMSYVGDKAQIRGEIGALKRGRKSVRL